MSRTDINTYYTARVPGLRRSGREWRGPCPIHQGTRDSFAVNPESGQWMCHSECGQGADMVALEAALTGVDRETAYRSVRTITGAERGERTIAAEYSYTDEFGDELFQVVRFSPKGFAQRHRSSSTGEWVWNRGKARPVLYRMHELAAAPKYETVWIVEGEKDVHTLEAWGLLATTNAGGAGKWPAPTGVLAKRPVRIVPDNDEPGIKHARSVAEYLKGYAASVEIVVLPRGKDVSDFAALGGSREELEALAPEADGGLNTLNALNRHNFRGSTAPEDPGWPEPMGPAAYHGITGRIVRSMEPHTEADAAALLVQFLTAFGSAIGRSAHFMAEADRHYTNLFAVMIGDTARGRKGTSWGQIARLLNEVDAGWVRDHISSGAGSGEGVIWAVRDDENAPPMADRPDKRMLIQEPEFARLLQVAERESNTLSAVLRQAWDTGNLRVMTKHEAARATDAHISIIGHITSDELRKRLSSNSAANGFANRFLWVCVKRSKLLPFGGAWKIDPEIVRDLKATLDWARSERQIQRDDFANQLWAVLYPRFGEGMRGMALSVTSRAEAQTMRLATLYAVLDRSAVITAEHLKAAYEVWQYTAESALFVFHRHFGSTLQDKIQGALIEAGACGLTRTQVRECAGRNHSIVEISQVLQSLESAGAAVKNRMAGPGRWTELWRAA